MKNTTGYAHRLKSRETIQLLHNLANLRWQDESEPARLAALGILPEYYASCLPMVGAGFFRATPERWAEARDKTARKLLRRLAGTWKSTLVELTAFSGCREETRVVRLDALDRSGKPGR